MSENVTAVMDRLKTMTALELSELKSQIESTFGVTAAAPVAALIVAVSLTGHVEVASAVLWISIAGVLLAWLSGAVLDLCRTRERNVRARSLLHAVACIVGILSIGYIKVTRDGLLDMIAETVKFGPGA